MNDQITTSGVVKQRDKSALSAVPFGRSLPLNASAGSWAVDVMSFLFLIVFQCASVIVLVLYTPQIGEMGLIVFGIIFVWLGATIILGACDLSARQRRLESK